MPTFELMDLQEAQATTVTAEQALIRQEYLGYINQLKEGQAGKLAPSEGESAAAIRRRLGAAAKAAGRDIVIKRKENDVYFWLKPRGRGRPRQKQARE